MIIYSFSGSAKIPGIQARYLFSRNILWIPDKAINTDSNTHNILQIENTVII